MKSKTLKVCIIILSILVLSVVAYLLSTRSQFHFIANDTQIDVNRVEWKKMKDPTDFAENFQHRSTRSTERFEQVITVYKKPLTDDVVANLPNIAEGEWLELFIVHPNTVTAQLYINKGSYYVMSRQTFDLSNFPSLQALNPEGSVEEFIQYLNGLDEEIQNTEYVINSQF